MTGYKVYLLCWADDTWAVVAMGRPRSQIPADGRHEVDQRGHRFDGCMVAPYSQGSARSCEPAKTQAMSGGGHKYLGQRQWAGTRPSRRKSSTKASKHFGRNSRKNRQQWICMELNFAKRVAGTHESDEIPRGQCMMQETS